PPRPPPHRTHPRPPLLRPPPPPPPRQSQTRQLRRHRRQRRNIRGAVIGFLRLRQRPDYLVNRRRQIGVRKSALGLIDKTSLVVRCYLRSRCPLARLAR